MQAPLTPQTPATLINTLLGPAILHQNPLATAALYDRLYHLMLARGHGSSFFIDGIAGLDLALWDLKARKYGVPLFELLGGPFRTELRAYVSGLRVKTVDEKVAAAKKYIGLGFAGREDLYRRRAAVPWRPKPAQFAKRLAPDAFFALDAICRHELSPATRRGASCSTR